MFDYRRQIPHFRDDSIVRTDTALATCSQPRKSQLDVRNVATSSEKGSSDGKIGKLLEVEQNMGIHPIPLISPHESRPGFGIAQERPSKWNLARLALAGEAQIEAFT